MSTTASPQGTGDLDPQGVVLRFLESVGRPAEARFYLDLFRARPREQFAAIAIDANVMRDAAEAVVLDLRFLTALDLFPAVVLGIFQPAESAAQARRLCRRLQDNGVGTEVLDAADADLADRLVAATRREALPIVTFAPVDGTQPADRFDALGRLLGRLGTRKLIFLHRPGGLRVAGALVPLVNLSTDVPALLASKQLSRKETLILEQSRRLAHDLAAQRLVASVTAPLDLLRELFTVKGAGTLLRRGATIRRHEGWEGVDRDRIRELLASAFGRPPLESFFDRAVTRVFCEEDYRGAAILVETTIGAYLSKFAVTPEAQGEGIARELWDDLAAEFPVVFWRARPANPINDWYAKLADGLVRLPEWHVFWKGLPHERIPAAIAHALAQPVDIPSSDPPEPGAAGS